MKYFLLDYDHATSEVSVTPIEEISEALAAYSEREREVLGSSHEVVLFYGESEDDLRRTHARYFVGIAELADRAMARATAHARATRPEARAAT
ncbi:MAG: hypothetical protein OXC94_06945 [Chloroflexi bacterium]|nr:hypothetical protein [Chloroflexota bacterium]